MFKALEIDNFKAFGRPTRIEFAPITLLFGQNSAGKSSVLNALNLLKQTRQSRDASALLLPRAERGLVDLGSFHELLYDHDLSRTLSFRIDLESAKLRRLAREFDVEEGILPAGFKVGFRRDRKDSDVTLEYLETYLGSGDEPYVRFEPQELGRTDQAATDWTPYRMWRDRVPLRPGDMQTARCVKVTADPAIWTPLCERSRRESTEILSSIKLLKEYVFREGSDKQRSLFAEENTLKDAFERAREFYSSEFALSQFIERMQQAELRSVLALDGFIPMPGRAEQSLEFPELVATRELMRAGKPHLSYSLDGVRVMVEVGRILDHALHRLFPLGPYRRAPERLYIFTGTTPPDVGYSGNLLPDLLFRKPALVRETNDWLDRLQLGYHIKIHPVGDSSNELFELRLIDKRRSAEVSVALSDVGFGISQLLPLVVQTLASEQQTITVEQPEVHVHPALQADLGDLLIEGTRSPRGHRFIIETHSEHLLLRLLKRIRETNSGELTNPNLALSPNDVSVIYIRRGDAGAEVQRLRIDESGEFIDRWPDGFFEERAEELF